MREVVGTLLLGACGRAACGNGAALFGSAAGAAFIAWTDSELLFTFLLVIIFIKALDNSTFIFIHISD